MGMEEETKRKNAKRETSVKERRKKAKKRDDVLPEPRATYGTLGARLLITRSSLFPSFSLPLLLSVSSRPRLTAKVSSPDSLR